MKWRKAVSIFCLVLAVLLSDIMCAAVAFNYVDIVWGMKYAGYSAPPSTAFRLFIPFGIAIAICLLVAWIFGKSDKRMQDHGENTESVNKAVDKWNKKLIGQRTDHDREEMHAMSRGYKSEKARVREDKSVAEAEKDSKK